MNHTVEFLGEETTSQMFDSEVTSESNSSVLLGVHRLLNLADW